MKVVYQPDVNQSEANLRSAKKHLSELLSENLANFYLNDLKWQYLKADKDKSGTIDREELIPIIKQFAEVLQSFPIGLSTNEEQHIYGKFKDPSKKTIDEVFERFDVNKDGLIQLEEFQTFGIHYLCKIIEDLSMHMI